VVDGGELAPLVHAREGTEELGPVAEPVRQDEGRRERLGLRIGSREPLEACGCRCAGTNEQRTETGLPPLAVEDVGAVLERGRARDAYGDAREVGDRLERAAERGRVRPLAARDDADGERSVEQLPVVAAVRRVAIRAAEPWIEMAREDDVVLREQLSRADVVALAEQVGVARRHGRLVDPAGAEGADRLRRTQAPEDDAFPVPFHDDAIGRTAHEPEGARDAGRRGRGGREGVREPPPGKGEAHDERLGRGRGHARAGEQPARRRRLHPAHPAQLGGDRARVATREAPRPEVRG
jgi:hypothetical protein